MTGRDDPHARPLSFDDVYRDHVRSVYGFFGYRLSSREAAEDLTQATFERALRAWPRYDAQRSKPSTWLLAIARNLLIDHYRADRSSTLANLDDHGDALQVPGPSVPGITPRLERALAGLNDREREIIALSVAGDLNGPEIAEVTGLTLANVQQILSRSRKALRAALEDDGDA